MDRFKALVAVAGCAFLAITLAATVGRAPAESGQGQAGSGPGGLITFVQGQVASAADVNANFVLLESRIASLEAAGTLENSSFFIEAPQPCDSNFRWLPIEGALSPPGPGWDMVLAQGYFDIPQRVWKPAAGKWLVVGLVGATTGQNPQILFLSKAPGQAPTNGTNALNSFSEGAFYGLITADGDTEFTPYQYLPGGGTPTTINDSRVSTFVHVVRISG